MNFISDRRFSIKVCRYLLSIKRFLTFGIFSLNVVSEGVVRRILNSFVKSFFYYLAGDKRCNVCTERFPFF